MLRPKRRGVGLTSLVDVVFILLLFFMLTSSFSQQQQLALASPVSSALADETTPQRLGLTAAADLKPWGEPQVLTDQDLVLRFDRNKPLLLSASAEASVQTLVAALMHLDSLGFTQVSIGPLWQDGTQ